MVYFIQADKNGPIKIGVSNNPSARLRQLQTGSHASLNLLAVIDGDMKKEHEIHKMFEKFRTDGEWFQPDYEILAYIANVTSDNRLDIVECPACGMQYLPNLPEYLSGA